MAFPVRGSIKFMRNKPDWRPEWIEVFGATAFFVVLSPLAYIAFSDKELTIATRSSGTLHLHGTRAVEYGFFLLALALAAVGYPLHSYRRRFYYWTVLLSCWIGILIYELFVGL